MWNHTAFSVNAWPWQRYLSTWHTSVRLVQARVGHAYLWEYVRLHWDCLHVRQYLCIHKLVSINNSRLLLALLNRNPKSTFMESCIFDWSIYSWSRKKCTMKGYVTLQTVCYFYFDMVKEKYRNQAQETSCWYWS